MDTWTPVVATVMATLIVGLGTFLVRTMVKGLRTYLEDEIRSKLVPNGGKSLADRVERIEKAIENLTTLSEGGKCLNPGCPERFRCQHMPGAGSKWKFPGLFG